MATIMGMGVAMKYGWVEKWGERPSVWPRPFCAYCGRALVYRQDVGEHLFTMSGAPFESGERIYFYWAHRTCNQLASPGQRMATFDAIKAGIRKDQENVKKARKCNGGP